MIYDVSRIAGTTLTRHIRAPSELPALCGAKPVPALVDLKPTSLWIRLAETETPLDHATCYRCIEAYKKGVSNEQ